jgi:hypothetical protein
MKQVGDFAELKQVLFKEHGLHYHSRKTDGVSNELHHFSSNGVTPTHILKGLPSDNLEIDFYLRRLPRIEADFEVLQLPELLGVYELPDKTYILLPYYDGETFDFLTPDAAMAKQMVAVVKDLLKVNVEDVTEGGSNFDYERVEEKYWQLFEIAISEGLIQPDDIDRFREISESILTNGRDTQQMILSNYDFNPRNLIRLRSKLVLIDWSKTVAPLEHHLMYPWLLNFDNRVCPNWQKLYAVEFESHLPINPQNIRYQLMYIALKRAVDEMENYHKLNKHPFPLKMATNHIQNFREAMAGANSLIDLSL